MRADGTGVAYINPDEIKKKAANLNVTEQRMTDYAIQQETGHKEFNKSQMSNSAAIQAIYNATGYVVSENDAPASMVNEAYGEYASTLFDKMNGGDLGIKVGSDFASTSASLPTYALFKYLIMKSSGEALQQLGYQGTAEQLGREYLNNLSTARESSTSTFGTIFDNYAQQLGGKKFTDAFTAAYIKNLGAVGDAAKTAREQETQSNVA